MTSFDELVETLELDAVAIGDSNAVFGHRDETSPFVKPTFDRIHAASDGHVHLISARGATGKSRLALELSDRCRVPLWRLQDDKAVSGDALGARIGAFTRRVDPASAVHEGEFGSLIVDSLDEARLRVTGQSWAEFVDALAEFSLAGMQLVLLGRTRTMEDVWVELEDRGVQTSIYQLSHFAEQQQAEYVDQRALRGEQATAKYAEAREAVLGSLRAHSETDLGEAFVGYAPVLDAVAKLVELGTNHQQVIQTFTESVHGERRLQVLTQILLSLLDREHGKVAAVADDLGIDASNAYRPAEQVAWLAHEGFEAEAPSLEWCPVDIRASYVEQLQGFRDDHPFRDGGDWASPVFGAFVCARKIHTVSDAAAALEVANLSGLLFEFAVDSLQDGEYVTEDGLAILQASLQAGEWIGSEASVTVSSGQNGGEESATAALALYEEDAGTRGISLEVLLDREAHLVVRAPMSSTWVSIPGTVTVQAGPSGSIDLGPDVTIDAHEIVLSGATLQIVRPADESGGWASADVELIARERFQPTVGLSPTTRVADLQVMVPDGMRLTYPWILHRSGIDDGEEAVNDAARRCLDKLMSLARRHGRDGPRGVFIKKWQGRQGLPEEEFQSMIQVLRELGVISGHEMILIDEDWDEFRYDGKRREGMPPYEDVAPRWEPVLETVRSRLKS